MKNKTSVQKCVYSFDQRSALILLLLLVCGDLIFITMHFLHTFTPFLKSYLFNIERDKGYAEFYQYFKFILIIFLLLYISLRNKTIHYIAWVLVFTYFFFDDSFRIHEKFGRKIAKKLSFVPPFGLRLQDIGELTISLVAGMALVTFVVWAYKSGSQAFRKTSADITLLILILVFFGVGVDMLDIILVNLYPQFSFILGLIEDGGEMLSLSVLVWYAFLIKVRGDKTGDYLIDFARNYLTKRSS